MLMTAQEQAIWTYSKANLTAFHHRLISKSTWKISMPLGKLPSYGPTVNPCTLPHNGKTIAAIQASNMNTVAVIDTIKMESPKELCRPSVYLSDA